MEAYHGEALNLINIEIIDTFKNLNCTFALQTYWQCIYICL